MADRSDPALGFIGLGLIGWPMAERLIAAGRTVTVWNRTADKMAPALAKGARAGASPAAVARASDIVFTCVTDDKAVAEVVFGKDGIIEAASPAKILVDFSTIPPDAARRFAKRLKDESGMRWIDAPVTGGRVGAIAGRLVVMAGGDEPDIEAVRPVIDHLAQRLTRMGPLGAGLVTKLCNQVVNACTKIVLCEMLNLARHGGIDGGRLPEVVKGGSADSSQLQREVPRMVKRDFSPPHGTAQTVLKDLDIIAEFAKETGTALPLTSLVTAFFRLHCAKGNADLDSIAIYKMFDEDAG